MVDKIGVSFLYRKRGVYDFIRLVYLITIHRNRVLARIVALSNFPPIFAYIALDLDTKGYQTYPKTTKIL